MANHQIKATVLADSITSQGARLTTFELEYHRWIHAELLTHSALARNAASSRAIPVSKLAKGIKTNPALPAFWGAQEPGMQSHKELSGIKLVAAKALWKMASYSAATFSQLLALTGLHKQYANRPSEYAQVYKVVMSATELDNFFNLRIHPDAQPEIYKLAVAVREAQKASTPLLLSEGEWHLPYVTSERGPDKKLRYFTGTTELSLEEAKKVSASCCAQVSYRLLDTSLPKAIKIHDMLVSADVLHASPFEHLATPITSAMTLQTDGITHQSKDLSLWSGKFKGFIQARHLIPNNTCTNYKEY